MNANEFDLWAERYDSDVSLSEHADTYPFSGYNRVLSYIYREIHLKAHGRVLDMGFGTATLTEKLYKQGHDIYGVDFSQEMVDIAKGKMPNAKLIKHDISLDLPQEIASQTFDFIISTYVFHHFDEAQKVSIIQRLLQLLKPDGVLLLGDVAFSTKEEMSQCENSNPDVWDHDEKYLVYEKIRICFPQAEFQQISSCSGVLSISI